MHEKEEGNKAKRINALIERTLEIVSHSPQV
jgi:hypothetical protein